MISCALAVDGKRLLLAKNQAEFISCAWKDSTNWQISRAEPLVRRLRSEEANFGSQAETRDYKVKLMRNVPLSWLLL
jgi:hypothetical protein